MNFDLDKRVAVLGIARMADAFGNSFLIVVLPLYIVSGNITGDTFGLSEAMLTGIILALFGLVNSVIQPFAGRVSDLMGRRKFFVMLGLVILGFANFAFSIGESYSAVFVIRALQGVAAALTITASIALVNELSVTGSRGRNMGTYNSFRLVGFGVGPLAGGLVVESGPYTLPAAGSMQISGFEASFYLAALSALVSLTLVALFVDDPEEIEPTAEKLNLAIRAKDSDHILDPIFTLGLCTLAMAGSIALLSTIEPQVNERLDQGAVWFGVQFAVFIGALALTQPLVGSASDHYGRRRFIIAGLIFLIPTTLAQGLVVTSEQMVVARLLQGISGAMVFSPALALAGDLARQGQSGAQLSVLTVAFGLGISFGQLSSGFLIRFGFVAPFLFGAVVAAIGAALVYTQVEETRAEEEEEGEEKELELGSSTN